jgi:hypothetical protein
VHQPQSTASPASYMHQHHQTAAPSAPSLNHNQETFPAAFLPPPPSYQAAPTPPSTVTLAPAAKVKLEPQTPNLSTAGLGFNNQQQQP